MEVGGEAEAPGSAGEEPLERVDALAVFVALGVAAGVTGLASRLGLAWGLLLFPAAALVWLGRADLMRFLRLTLYAAMLFPLAWISLVGLTLGLPGPASVSRGVTLVASLAVTVAAGVLTNRWLADQPRGPVLRWLDALGWLVVYGCWSSLFLWALTGR